MKKFLPTHGVSLKQESGKLVETLGLAGLFCRIWFQSIRQLNLGHFKLRWALPVDLVHKFDLFGQGMSNRKTLFPDLIQGIGKGMF